MPDDATNRLAENTIRCIKGIIIFVANSYTLYYLSFLLLLLLAACGNQPSSVKESPSSPFQGDSGYLTKQQLLSYAIHNKLTDTTGCSSYWDKQADHDTMGKYYRYKDGYLTLMRDFVPPFESLVLFETTADGTPENSAQYVHGNSNTCWDHPFGFGRIREYFYLETCGAETAVNLSIIYLFRDFEQQSPEHAIYKSIRKERAGTYRDLQLTSLQTDGDMLHTEYVVKEGRDNNAAEKEVDRFKLDYVYTKGEWLPDDTLLYKNRLKGFY